MIRRVKLASGLLLLALLCQPLTVRATTSLNVVITENDLKLVKVEPPDFGKHTLTGEGQTVTSQKDLVIQVKDERGVKNSPWQLSYGFRPFANTEASLPAKAQYQIGVGKLTDVSRNQASEAYEAETVAVTQQETTVQLLQKAGESTTDPTLYEYRVAKEQIRLVLPAKTTPGKYEALQIIQLQNVPSD